MGFNPFIGGGGGGVTPEDVQNMITASIDIAVSPSSTNAVQNKVIKEYVDTGLSNKADASSLADVAISGDYEDLINSPTVDSSISTTSTNAVQNATITNFVNSSIETSTATFRGTYTTIEALNAAAGDKNDYAFYNHTDAAGNTVFDRYKFVPTEQADLPEGYTQLEYIESSGTQYIDTGVLPTSKRRMSIKFDPLSYEYATYFFGMSGYSNRGYHDPYYLNSDNGSGKFLIDGISAVVSLDFPGVNEFEYNYPYITLNGDSANIGDPGEWYYSAGGPTIYLFALNYRGSVSNHSTMRLYGCKLYDTDGVTLVRDFVPCKNASNIAGLYDLINATFYPNKGTGSFIAGPQANGYWEYEYTLNNSSFTADQWAAINSGITSSDKTQIANNTNDISSLNTNKLDKIGTAAKATADSAGNNIITTYAKKTDLNSLVCTYRGTYTTAEALNAASGDKNDFAFLKTTDSAGNEIYSRYSRVEIPQVVPEGYTQLMYISSNGTQYIDTGVQAKRDLKSYIKFTRKSGGNNQFFGIHDNGLYYALWFSDWRWQLWCGIGSNYVDISSASSGVTEYLLEYPTVTVNDTVFNFSAQADFTSEKTIYLCAVNGESNKSVIDLYECIIYDDDKTTELKHFYPCKNSSNVCGMYDIIEGVFYPDANGGNFTAGPQANGYWNFEYSIPGNLFSSVQFSALNSGINSAGVAQIETNKNNIIGIKDGTNIDSFSDVEIALDDKIDKENGKGLSTNDYTTTEKTKLAGIAEGAEVNIQSDWNQTDNSKDDYIKNKPTIPATASEISYDNTISHLEATDTQAAIDELAAITYPSINITADSGAIITATNGAITLTATMEQTSLKMLIPSYGKWTFSASLNGKVISKIINFTTSKIYDVELTFDNVYGVEWGLTGQTLSRIGAAAEFINPVPYVNNGMSAEDCSSPFDNLYPWNGMTRETVDGNEVVKIPKFWYKIEKTNSKLSIQIADAPRAGFNVSPAHRARGSYPEQDYVYIGRYHSDSNYKSTSGVIPIASITRATARTNQAAIGNGYHQLDFSLWITIWMLYLVEFANWNAQSMIGYNCGNNSSKKNTGSTDTMPYHTGTMQASKTTYGVGVQYRYIEDPWGNVLDWCDGITFGPDENNNAGEGIYCFEDFENYSDSYSASGAVLVGRRANVSNYIQDFDQSNVSGFDWVLYPGNGDTASSQNQIPDGCLFSASGVVLYVGGSYNQYAAHGLFCLYGDNAASYRFGGIGVRLQKIPSIN